MVHRGPCDVGERYLFLHSFRSVRSDTWERPVAREAGKRPVSNQSFMSRSPHSPFPRRRGTGTGARRLPVPVARPLSRPWLALAALAGSLGPVAAQETPVAFVGAKVIPIAGPEIDKGTVVVHRGKVVAVGAVGAVSVPAGATVRDMAGKVIMPGLVDTHSHIGGGSGGDGSSPINPECRILDTIDVQDAGFQRARSGGLTTLNIMPGSGHLLSGQTIYVKLRPAPRTIDDWTFPLDGGGIAHGIKMANGTNPIRTGGGAFPGTRGKSAAMVRALWVRAQEYREKVRAAGGDASKLPARDLGMEVLAEVLDGKRVVHHHTHKAEDILTVLRLSKEFGFKVVLHHLSDGWKVAKEIADAGVASSVIMIDAPGGKLEAVGLRYETPAALEAVGAAVGFHTDDSITDSRWFLRSAALAVRAGMTRRKALEGLTVAGARMLDLQHRIGTLEPGKDADLVVLSGDPLSIYTHVLETWVEGAKAFDRTDPKDKLVATGGVGATRGSHLHIDCFDQDHDNHGGGR